MLQGVPADTMIERAGGRMVLSLFTSLSGAYVSAHQHKRLGLDGSVCIRPYKPKALQCHNINVPLAHRHYCSLSQAGR